MDKGFTGGGIEQHPILFDLGAGGSGIAGEFCEGRVGLQRTKGKVMGRG